MALGAARVDVLRLVLSEGIATAAGVALGLAGAAALTSYIPALRAMRIEPVTALRAE